MKYKSALLTTGSGKIKGIVASHNRGGQYFRGLTIPTNPNTAQQQAVRNYLSQLQTRFLSTLTAAQRTAWGVYAAGTPVTDALGDSILLTAQQMYIKCNSPRLQAGASIVDNGPTTMGLITLTPPVLTLTANSASGSLAFTNTDAWATAVGGYLLLYTSRVQNATINYFKGPYRFAGKVAGAATPPTSPAVLTMPFSAGPTGSKIMYRVVALGVDGRVSPEIFLTSTV